MRETETDRQTDREREREREKRTHTQERGEESRIELEHEGDQRKHPTPHTPHPASTRDGGISHQNPKPNPKPYAFSPHQPSILNPPPSYTQVSSIELLHESDPRLGLIMVASDDGMLRGWRGFGERGDEVHAYTRTHAHTHMCVCVHAHLHVCICLHTYMHTLTHTH